MNGNIIPLLLILVGGIMVLAGIQGTTPVAIVKNTLTSGG